MDVAPRQGGLPPIRDDTHSTKQESDSKFSISQITNSENAMPPSGPPPPYTTSPQPSPKESRGPPSEKPELSLQTPASRQSLPSLKEALNSGGDSLAYNARSQHSPRNSRDYQYRRAVSPVDYRAEQSRSDSSPRAYTPLSTSAQQYLQNPPPTAPLVFTSYSSGLTTTRPSPTHTRPEWPAASTQTSSAGSQTAFAPWNSRRSVNYEEPPPRPSALPTPTRAYNPASSYPTSTSHAAPVTSAPTSHYPEPQSHFRPREDSGYREKDYRAPAQPPEYGDSVKRHLDSFDFEKTLHEVSEDNRVVLSFCDHYSKIAYHTQRNGLSAESMPHLGEIDEMMKYQNHSQQALERLRNIVHQQQVALLERSRESAAKAKVNNVHDETRPSSPRDDVKTAGFAGVPPDSKKRRGRAAPPGRCHSCNRAETPEWRRGPDGARTLCNACGLHFAKLTRKMGAGANKATPGSSNLRPKSMGPGSPST